MKKNTYHCKLFLLLMLITTTLKGPPGLPALPISSSRFTRAMTGRDDGPDLTRHTSTYVWFSMTSICLFSISIVTGATMKTDTVHIWCQMMCVNNLTTVWLHHLRIQLNTLEVIATKTINGNKSSESKVSDIFLYTTYIGIFLGNRSGVLDSMIACLTCIG